LARHTLEKLPNQNRQLASLSTVHQAQTRLRSFS
jgi:hypothetical protein